MGSQHVFFYLLFIFFFHISAIICMTTRFKISRRLGLPYVLLCVFIISLFYIPHVPCDSVMCDG